MKISEFVNKDNAISEASGEDPSRRRFLKKTAAAAALASTPGKSLTDIVGSQMAGDKSTSYIWQKVGDTADREMLSGVVNATVKSYEKIGIPLDRAVIMSRLNGVLRRHIPGMYKGKDTSKINKQWKDMMLDFHKQLPLPPEPEPWDEDNDERDYNDYEIELHNRENFYNGIATLAKITRDANLNDTEMYGYKVFPRQKKSMTSGVPSTNTVQQVAQQALTNKAVSTLPKTSIGPGVGGTIASLKKMIDKMASREKTSAQDKDIESPSAKDITSLPAPDKSSTEIMANLRDLVQKDKDAVAQPADKNKS